MSDFKSRVTSAFGRLVETVVKGDIKDAALVVHGGVIMTILATFGVPRAKFIDWDVNNGYGYSVRIMPSLWMRQKVVEVYSKVPYDLVHENDEESTYIVDLVGGASADTAILISLSYSGLFKLAIFLLFSDLNVFRKSSANGLSTEIGTKAT